MNTLKTKMVVVNVAGGLVALSALMAAARVMLVPATARPCGERYANTMKFQLQRDGEVLSTADIQARIGGNEAGLENVDVVKPRDARIPAALRVSLHGGASVAAGGGMSFPWQPRAVRNETAACLSYEVFLHGDLEYQGGGTLPGLRGMDQSMQTPESFTANLAWKQDGQPGVSLSLKGEGEAQHLRIDNDSLNIAKGRWIKVDEEVILNAPGQDNGVLRVWVDGALAIDRTDLSYRSKPEVTIAGVSADVRYGREDANAAPSADTKIWISPFEISWR
jgi:hypothetical protein